MTDYWASVQGPLLEWVVRLVVLIVVVLVGSWVVRRLVALVGSAAERFGRVDPSLVHFVGSIVSFFCKYILIIVCFSVVGLSNDPLVAVFGAALLALAVSIDGTLADFAAGLLLSSFKYYEKSDIVVVAGTLGIVLAIDVSTTRLLLPTGQVEVVSNSAALGGSIVVVGKAQRPVRLRLPFVLARSADVHEARALVLAELARDPSVLAEPAAEVVVTDLADGRVSVEARPWIVAGQLSSAALADDVLHPMSRPSQLWVAGERMVENVRAVLASAGLLGPTPKRDAHANHVDEIPAPKAYEPWLPLSERPGGASTVFRRPKPEKISVPVAACANTSLLPWRRGSKTKAE